MRALVACALFLPFLDLRASGQASRPLALHAPLTKAGTTAAPSPLRITHVSLYKNGVGFFEHVGQVKGDGVLSLDLTSAQLNDMLQSLTAVDLGGGHLTGANYNSTTPLDQQLSALPLNLGAQPSEQDLFAVLRGSRVEVTGSGATFTGRLLATEVRTPEADDGESLKPVRERRFLTVVADSGATRSVELTPNTVVRMLDPGLRADLNTYLELLNRNRTDGVRHLVLSDHGVGTREVRVSFLSEVPVWKSTYRVLLTAGENNGQATVQGFSVVDNTTGEDWNGVQLSLIAGSPQSFLQPISQPIYDRRPEVAVAENAQITPQTHESATDDAGVPKGSASADLGSSSGGNPGTLFGSPTGTGMGTGGPTVVESRLRAPSKIPKNINRMKDTGPPPPPTPMVLPHAAAASPEMIDQLRRQTVEVNATTASFDDFFAYNLTDPVTIPRNGSALVPILQARLPVESVTLWSGRDARPLRALWITNTSDVTLDRGSFSVVENASFAGEGLLEPVHAGEKRLLSYAVDQAVRVTVEGNKESHRLARLSVAKGVLTATNTEVAEVTYRVSDAAPEARTVLLEEPRRTGWTLEQTSAAEATPNVYRFRVPVAAHGSAKLTVVQRHVVDQSFALVNSTEEQLTNYVHENGADDKVLGQLQPVFAAQRRLAEIEEHIMELQDRQKTIGEDQDRLRKNLSALKGSAEEKALVRRYSQELEAQEDALNGLKRDLALAEDQRAVAMQQLSDQIAALQVNETV